MINKVIVEETNLLYRIIPDNLDVLSSRRWCITSYSLNGAVPNDFLSKTTIWRGGYGWVRVTLQWRNLKNTASAR